MATVCHGSNLFLSSVSLLVLLQDAKLTVTQLTSANSASCVLLFQYQLSEQAQWSWETVLSSCSLYLGVSDGALPEGSKEG